VSAAAAGIALAYASGVAAQGAAGGQWPTYGGDLGSTRYAPLAQIDASNFGTLEVAWRFSVANLGPTREYTFESTPLVIDGVMYTTGGTRRAVTALDGVPLRLVSQAASRRNITFVLRDADVPHAMMRLHETFF